MCLGVLLVPFGGPCLDLVDECGLRRDPAPKAWTTEMAQFHCSHVEPTAVCGRRMALSCSRDSFRLRRIKSVIKRGFGIRIAMVHHSTNFVHIRIMLLHQLTETIRPINRCALCCAFRVSVTHAWCQSHTNVGRPIALLLGVIPQGLPRHSRERSTDVPHHLGRHVIHTSVRTRRIVRFFLPI
jgi:hypothetical protein